MGSRFVYTLLQRQRITLLAFLYYFVGILILLMNEFKLAKINNIYKPLQLWDEQGNFAGCTRLIADHPDPVQSC